MFYKKMAFTLAEVLITLGIIGIVAALTIPTLMNKYQKSRDYNAMKKAYSSISDAASRIRADNANSMVDLATDTPSFMNLFKPYFKILKTCETPADSPKCYIKNEEQVSNLQGGKFADLTNDFANHPKFVTADGMVYVFINIDTTCNDTRYIRNGQGEFCGAIWADINGNNKPNTMGKDIFEFSINKYNVTPYRDYQTADETTLCSLSSTYSVNGVSCAYRAIAEGGIFYY